MFNQASFNATTNTTVTNTNNTTTTTNTEPSERDNLRILQTLNVQIQSMAVKLDQILTQTEENIFKVKSSPNSSYKSTLYSINNNENMATTNLNVLNGGPIELGNNHQLIKIIDQPMILTGKEAKCFTPNKQQTIANLTKPVEQLTYSTSIPQVIEIQSMAAKLDRSLAQTEENILKLKSSPNSNNTNNTNSQKSPQTTYYTLNPASTNLLGSNGQIYTINSDGNLVLDAKILNDSMASNLNIGNIELGNNYQLVKIIDPPPQLILTPNKEASKPPHAAKRTKQTIANLTRQENMNMNSNNITSNNNTNTSLITTALIPQGNVQPLTTLTLTNTVHNQNLVDTSSNQQQVQNGNSNNGVVTKKEPKVSPSSQLQNKRNKQQRMFNTFVRESICQLLGPDYMKSHDVQDIDPQLMEMIRKEAVENYLPDNIRPRRAWHLAKASLRTLKRTLNNKKI